VVPVRVGLGHDCLSVGKWGKLKKTVQITCLERKTSGRSDRGVQGFASYQLRWIGDVSNPGFGRQTRAVRGVARQMGLANIGGREWKGEGSTSLGYIQLGVGRRVQDKFQWGDVLGVTKKGEIKHYWGVPKI